MRIDVEIGTGQVIGESRIYYNSDLILIKKHSKYMTELDLVEVESEVGGARKTMW